MVKFVQSKARKPLGKGNSDYFFFMYKKKYPFYAKHFSLRLCFDQYCHFRLYCAIWGRNKKQICWNSVRKLLIWVILIFFFLYNIRDLKSVILCYFAFYWLCSWYFDGGISTSVFNVVCKGCHVLVIRSINKTEVSQETY